MYNSWWKVEADIKWDSIRKGVTVYGLTKNPKFWIRADNEVEQQTLIQMFLYSTGENIANALMKAKPEEHKDKRYVQSRIKSIINLLEQQKCSSFQQVEQILSTLQVPNWRKLREQRQRTREEDKTDPNENHDKSDSEDIVSDDEEEYEKDFISLIFEHGCLEFGSIRHPKAFAVLSELVPTNIKGIWGKVNKGWVSGHQLDKAIDDAPWKFAFSQVLFDDFGIGGCEPTMWTYKNSELYRHLSLLEKDAFHLYHNIKRYCKNTGHTYLREQQIYNLRDKSSEYRNIAAKQDALQFLEDKRVVVREMRGEWPRIFLRYFWQCEVDIASSLKFLFQNDTWQFGVDLTRKEFEKMDEDQIKAAVAIGQQPVLVLSGRGGCGKTTIVSTVLHYAAKACEWSDPGSRILLTAPTGKAAQILEQKTKFPAFTIYQVNLSHMRWLGRGRKTRWKHREVEVLVVDESSMVSVGDLSNLLRSLQNHARLNKVILLGDIYQLPSISPGNMLEDMFRGLQGYHCSLVLTKNHRSNADLIIKNAIRISNSVMPVFNPEKHFHHINIMDDKDQEEIIRNLLRSSGSPDLRCHKSSQFVAFLRNDVKKINDICCKHYAGHSRKMIIKGRERTVFRIGDKVCCMKNLDATDLLAVEKRAKIQKQREKKQRQKEKEQAAKKNSLLLPPALSVEASDGEPVGDTQATAIADYAQGNPSNMEPAGDARCTESADNGNGNTSNMEPVGDAHSPQDEDEEEEEKLPNPQARLCNGEIFFIIDDEEIQERDRKNRYLTLENEFRTVKIDYRVLRAEGDLNHAWARTIHTFQGSETPTVVYYVGSCPVQDWQHVYTAVTRGSEEVVIVTHLKKLDTAVRNKPRVRQTSLYERILSITDDLPEYNKKRIMEGRWYSSATPQPKKPSGNVYDMKQDEQAAGNTGVTRTPVNGESNTSCNQGLADVSENDEFSQLEDSQYEAVNALEMTYSTQANVNRVNKAPEVATADSNVARKLHFPGNQPSNQGINSSGKIFRTAHTTNQPSVKLLPSNCSIDSSAGNSFQDIKPNAANPVLNRKNKTGVNSAQDAHSPHDSHKSVLSPLAQSFRNDTFHLPSPNGTDLCSPSWIDNSFEEGLFSNEIHPAETQQAPSPTASHAQQINTAGSSPTAPQAQHNSTTGSSHTASQAQQWYTAGPVVQSDNESSDMFEESGLDPDVIAGSQSPQSSGFSISQLRPTAKGPSSSAMTVVAETSSSEGNYTDSDDSVSLLASTSQSKRTRKKQKRHKSTSSSNSDDSTSLLRFRPGGQVQSTASPNKFLRLEDSIVTSSDVSPVRNQVVNLKLK